MLVGVLVSTWQMLLLNCTFTPDASVAKPATKH
jgi:hypothetical protein